MRQRVNGGNRRGHDVGPERERAMLASIDQKITKKEDATVDAHRDLRTDRSAVEHPSPKTPHK